METDTARSSAHAEPPVADFDSFFRDHFEGVVRAGALVARDASTGQDLAQEAFVKLHLRWDRMESPDHARNFVYRVAVNLARSHLRKHLRMSLVGLRRSEPSDPAVDVGDAAAEWLRISDALDGLSPRQRACAVLVDYVGLDPAVVARALRISASTLRVHLARARSALRERLAQEEAAR